MILFKNCYELFHFFFFLGIFIECYCFMILDSTLKGLILFWLLFWGIFDLDLFVLGVIFFVFIEDFRLCLLLLLPFTLIFDSFLFTIWLYSFFKCWDDAFF